MKKITFTTALLASACAFAGFEGHVSSDGYVPGLQQGIFRDGGVANVNFYATCAEADRFSHTLGTILADVNSSRLCQTRNELSGAIEKWEARAAVLYEGEMYFEGEREYNFFGAVDNYVACQLDGDCLFCQGGRTLGPKVAVFSKTFNESGWHSIRVWIADYQSFHGARSSAAGFQGMGIGWNTNGCKVVNSTTQLQWNRLLDDGSGRFLRSKVLPQKSAKSGERGPVGMKDGEVRIFGAQDGLPCEIEMAWVVGRGEVDGFWVSKNCITQRQWKNVIRDSAIEEDGQNEHVQVLPRHLHMRDEYILDFIWGLNARHTGAGRFTCLSDAQCELAAKYCESVKRRNEDYGFRVALVPNAKKVSTVTDTEGKETDAVAGTNGLYCVIDISGGSSAKRYPVSYLDAVPKGGWTDEYKTTKIVLRRIDAGTWPMMGGGVVTFTMPFYIGIFELTQKQVKLVSGNGSKKFVFENDMRPADNLTFGEMRGKNEEFDYPKTKEVAAESIIGRLRAKTGLAQIDLPTSYQFGCAWNAGTDGAGRDARLTGRHYGNQRDGKGGFSSAHTVVGSYQPNEWGIYDLHGNVWEMCLDYAGKQSQEEDPEGPEKGEKRLCRGGGWHSSDRFVSADYVPQNTEEDESHGWSGCRIVINVRQPKAIERHTQVESERAWREAERAELRAQLRAIRDELTRVRKAKAAVKDSSPEVCKAVEGGYTLPVPLFINEGDVIRINTETGEYNDRTATK